MELHPILETGVEPNPHLWYVLSAVGECPSARVGHTCTYVPSATPGANGRLLVVGGANPDGAFADSYMLDLDTYTWGRVGTPSPPTPAAARCFSGRYEHAAWAPDCQPDHLYVFGGADQSGNHSDVTVLRVSSGEWKTVRVSGAPPSPRTYHATGAHTDDELVVYSGGQAGGDPVGDRQVHAFSIHSHHWRTLKVSGNPPKPRQGHLVLGIGGGRLLVHGGMSGAHFYDDLHMLTITSRPAGGGATSAGGGGTDGDWRLVKTRPRTGGPCARAAHAGVHVCAGAAVYVFGGMSRNGALDDLYKLDTDTWTWSKVLLEGPPPTCRLDFSMCIIPLVITIGSKQVSTDSLRATGLSVKEVLNTQLSRMSSASSIRSVGSAGSRVSAAGSFTTNTHEPFEQTEKSSNSSPQNQPKIIDLTSGSPVSYNNLESLTSSLNISDKNTANDSPIKDDISNEVITETLIQSKSVKLCLVFGGMDTEGEIFEDTMIYLIPDK